MTVMLRLIEISLLGNRNEQWTTDKAFVIELIRASSVSCKRNYLQRFFKI